MAVQQRRVDRFDRRLVERRIEKGDMTAEELQSFLGGLPDLTDNLEVVETQLESSAEDDDEDEDEGE